MTNWQIMFTAKATSRDGRIRTFEQRGGESFNTFISRVERICKYREVTIQVREIVGSGVRE
jgi:hypothetical protein